MFFSYSNWWVLAPDKPHFQTSSLNARLNLLVIAVFITLVKGFFGFLNIAVSFFVLLFEVVDNILQVYVIVCRIQEMAYDYA